MINPSEISEVLKQQLENVNKHVTFDEVGKVLESTNTFWILYSILESANNRNEEIAITVH